MSPLHRFRGRIDKADIFLITALFIKSQLIAQLAMQGMDLVVRASHVMLIFTISCVMLFFRVTIKIVVTHLFGLGQNAVRIIFDPRFGSRIMVAPIVFIGFYIGNKPLDLFNRFFSLFILRERFLKHGFPLFIIKCCQPWSDQPHAVFRRRRGIFAEVAIRLLCFVQPAT